MNLNVFCAARACARNRCCQGSYRPAYEKFTYPFFLKNILVNLTIIDPEAPVPPPLQAALVAFGKAALKQDEHVRNILSFYVALRTIFRTYSIEGNKASLKRRPRPLNLPLSNRLQPPPLHYQIYRMRRCQRAQMIWQPKLCNHSKNRRRTRSPLI